MLLHELPVTSFRVGRGVEDDKGDNDVKPDKKNIDWGKHLRTGFNYAFYPVIATSSAVILASFRKQIVKHLGIADLVDDFTDVFDYDRRKLIKRVDQKKAEIQQAQEKQSIDKMKRQIEELGDIDEILGYTAMYDLD